jgi:hypothetical protein
MAWEALPRRPNCPNSIGGRATATAAARTLKFRRPSVVAAESR